jgi:hypothetical protein
MAAQTEHAPGGAPPLPAAGERGRVLRDAVLPVLLGGVIKRNAFAMALAERRQWDARGIEAAGRLHRRYGRGPVPLLHRGRSVALVLDPLDARRLLDQTPATFSPAAREKVNALARFQPHGVLISEPGEDRAVRRERNEAVLATGHSVHPSAGRFLRVALEETGHLLTAHADRAPLAWAEFEAAWWRIVRRMVLGEAARADTTVTDQLNTLRRDGNWPLLPQLSPRRRLLRAAFRHRIESYARRADEQELAGHAYAVDAVGQIPHWLFAYDAAGVTALRTLAVLATHPEAAEQIREELAGAPPDRPREWPRLRAAVLETVRLWPTTPLVLRESRQDSSWENGAAPEGAAPNGARPGIVAFPAGTLFAVYTPYLHRGEPAGPQRDRFAPGLWTDGTSGPAEEFLPFSAGAAGCPGENLVLFTVTAWLAALLAGHDVRLLSHRLDPDEPLPATLNHFALRFEVTRTPAP